MRDIQAIALLHRHGEGDWAPMEPSVHHGPAERDPERSWLRAGRLFQCTTCEEEVVIVPPGDEPPEGDAIWAAFKGGIGRG